MNEILIDVISVVVTSILIPLITFLGLKLSAYLKTKIESEKLHKHLDTAIEAVTIAVAAVMQTYVDSLKKSGSFTQEAQKAAFLQAKEASLKLITDETKKAITANFGDFNAWLEALIETKVKEIK